MKSIIFCLLLCMCFSLHAQPVALHGRLAVQEGKLVDAKNKPIALHGMSFGWHCFWPRFYNAGAVGTLKKDWQCTVVRAAMGVEPDKGYIKDSAGSVKNIKAVVDAAIQHGIYVIIDFHSHNIKAAEAKTFFTEMAAAYHQYPNIIYEIFNEPDYESWAEVKQYSINIINTIRAIDSSNIILVGNPHWDQDILLPMSDPITGVNNIMYSLHFYAATHKQFLRDQAATAVKNGLPVFISECAAMEASGDGPINETEWDAWKLWADKNMISWVAWSVSDKNETCSVLQPGASSAGPWKEADIKPAGLLMRKALHSYDTNGQLKR
jgi:endoglucanase